MSTIENKKRIVCVAQPCGFGPASKMYSIARLFKNNELIFLGKDIAYDFVDNSLELFNEVIDQNKIKNNELNDIIKNCDFLIIVMNHEIANIAHQLNKRYYFFDSLFGFWYFNKKDKNLFREFKMQFKENNKNFFNNLSVHEKKMASHYFSEISFIQNFIGVEKRYRTIKPFLRKSFLVKPFVIDLPKRSSRVGKYQKGAIIINLGGIKNFVTKSDESVYLNLINKTANKILRNNKSIKKITICSGLFKKHKILHINKKKTLIHRFYNKQEFLEEILNSEYYLTSPGLTSIIESIYLPKIPIFLPEQHSSQFYNLKLIRSTLLKNCSISIIDILGKKDISPQDFKGSLQIMDCIKEIYKNDLFFKKFILLLNNKMKEIKKIDQNRISSYIRNEIEKNSIDFNKVEKIIRINESHYV